MPISPRRKITIGPLDPMLPFPAPEDWLHAEATEGELWAGITLRLAGDPRCPGGYRMEVAYGWTDKQKHRPFGSRQQERAVSLLAWLRQQLTTRMEAAGWRDSGQRSSDGLGVPLWTYAGPLGVMQEQALARAARRIWYGRTTPAGREKHAPLEQFPMFRAWLPWRWHLVPQTELEVRADPDAGLVQVRRHQQVGQPERRPKVQKPLAVIGNVEARERHAVPAYQRTIRTRPVAFTCGWCGTGLMQERYPGPRPRYCSDTCQEEARREQSRQRQRRYRERHQNGMPPKA